MMLPITTTRIGPPPLGGEIGDADDPARDRRELGALEASSAVIWGRMNVTSTPTTRNAKVSMKTG